MPDSFEAPDPSRLFLEARGLIELPRLLLRFPELVWQPRGEGRPVLILPGYGAGDGSTAILKSYLKLLGYRARGWGLGRNTGTVFIDNPDRKVPNVQQATLGYERQLSQQMAATVDYVHSWNRDQLINFDLNPALRATTPSARCCASASTPSITRSAPARWASMIRWRWSTRR